MPRVHKYEPHKPPQHLPLTQSLDSWQQEMRDEWALHASPQDLDKLRTWLSQVANEHGDKRDKIFSLTMERTGQVATFNALGALIRVEDSQQGFKSMGMDSGHDLAKRLAREQAGRMAVERESAAALRAILHALGGTVMLGMDTVADSACGSVEFVQVMDSMSVGVRLHRTNPPVGPAARLFQWAAELEESARTCDDPVRAGVIIDLADEIRQAVRAAFAGLMSPDILDRLAGTETTAPDEAEALSKLPDKYWEGVPPQYRWAACDRKPDLDGQVRHTWYLFSEEPVTPKRLNNGKGPVTWMWPTVRCEIDKRGDIPFVPRDPLKSKTKRPEHL